MANVFGILTAIVLAVSAFVAMKNKDAYEEQIASRQTAQSKLASNQRDLKTATDDFNFTTEARTAEEATIAQLKAQETEQTAANTALQEQIDATRTKVEANQIKLTELSEKTASSGNLPELAANLRAAQAELEELSQLSAAAEASLANLTAENNSIEQVITGLRSEAEMVTRGESFPSLRTRISAIYPSWGFVTLAAGNNAGVVNNSTLDVVRGGETIGKLLVTAVESTTASASIIPDSVQEGVTLSVGDQVVPGTREAAEN